MALEVAGSSPVREPTLNEWSTLSESDRVVLFGFALFEVQSHLSHFIRQVFWLVRGINGQQASACENAMIVGEAPNEQVSQVSTVRLAVENLFLLRFLGSISLFGQIPDEHLAWLTGRRHQQTQILMLLTYGIPFARSGGDQHRAHRRQFNVACGSAQRAVTADAGDDGA